MPKHSCPFRRPLTWLLSVDVRAGQVPRFLKERVCAAPPVDRGQNEKLGWLALTAISRLFEPPLREGKPVVERARNADKDRVGIEHLG
jgi:hypothetical protein